MISPERFLRVIVFLLLASLFCCNTTPRPTGDTSKTTTFQTAIIRLPFHKYYREVGYRVDAYGHAIYQGDIDLGPENELLSLSESNRLKFKNGELPNGLVKLRTGTRFKAIRQQQINSPQPPVFTKSSVNLDPDLKWYGGEIPYEIDDDLDDPETLEDLEAAIGLLEDSTSLRFIPRVNHPDYIQFTDCPECAGAGSSAVGKKGGEQWVRLKEGEISRGGIVHELMHAIGIYHTHSRADRDEYVCVYVNNVLDGLEHSFDIHDGEDYAGVYGAYNTRSFMHYGSCAFARDSCTLSFTPNATILRKDSDGDCSLSILANLIFGSMPASDIATINYLYGPVAGGLGTMVPLDQVRTLTVYINRLTTLVGPEENGLGCNDRMDYYASVELGPLADISQDPYQFARSEVFQYNKKEGNDIWPGWTANIILQPGERYGFIKIAVSDDDKSGPGGIGACGGEDDEVDVSPFENMKKLHLVVDTQTNKVHLSRTTLSVPPGQPPTPNNLVFSSTLNGELGLLFQTVTAQGNTLGEDHSARIRVRVHLE